MSPIRVLGHHGDVAEQRVGRSEAGVAVDRREIGFEDRLTRHAAPAAWIMDLARDVATRCSRTSHSPRRAEEVTGAGQHHDIDGVIVGEVVPNRAARGSA